MDRGHATLTLLDQVLGDRVGAYVLASCLLVATLATIAAIIDIPIRALERAGFVDHRLEPQSVAARLMLLLGALAAIATFIPASQRRRTSQAREVAPMLRRFHCFWRQTPASCASLCASGDFTGPLPRHWDLSLGVFGLGLALAFLCLAWFSGYDLGIRTARKRVRQTHSPPRSAASSRRLERALRRFVQCSPTSSAERCDLFSAQHHLHALEASAANARFRPIATNRTRRHSAVPRSRNPRVNHGASSVRAIHAGAQGVRSPFLKRARSAGAVRRQTDPTPALNFPR